MKQDITIIVNSCDSYEDLWVPFFTLFKYYWPDCPYPIVLNTESKRFDYSDLRIKSMSLYKQSHNASTVSYSKRLKDHLQLIDTEYVILLLDDFFLRDFVNERIIEKCKRWMDADHNIAVFSFEEVKDDLNVPSQNYLGFELRPPVGEYKFNLQAAIWRTQRLIKYIRVDENPWEMETLGNYRTFRSKDLFFSTMHDAIRPFDYGFIYAGIWNVYRGKWVIETVEELFKKHGIIIDYNKRGIYSKTNSEVVRALKYTKQTTMKEYKDKLKLLRSIGISWIIRNKAHEIRKKLLKKYKKVEIGNYYDYLRARYRNSLSR